MEISNLDLAYQQLEEHCFREMTEKKIPASLMSYVINRLLATVLSLHVNELSQFPQPEETAGGAMKEEEDQ